MNDYEKTITSLTELYKELGFDEKYAKQMAINITVDSIGTLTHEITTKNILDLDFEEFAEKISHDSKYVADVMRKVNGSEEIRNLLKDIMNQKVANSIDVIKQTLKTRDDKTDVNYLIKLSSIKNKLLNKK